MCYQLRKMVPVPPEDHAAPGGEPTKLVSASSDADDTQLVPEPANDWWTRYTAHLISISVVFIICKLMFLAYAGVSPLVVPWLLPADVLVAAVVALLAKWPRVVRAVTDLLLLLYVFSLHYALLFGGFVGASFFYYIGETGGMGGSMLDLIRWPVLVVFVGLLVLHRFLDRRLPRWLALNSHRARWIAGILVSVSLFIEFTPVLDDYHEHRQHPVGKLTRSTFEARRTGHLDHSPTSAPSGNFDYHSQFEGEEAPVPELPKLPSGEKFNVIMLSMESTGTKSIARKDAETMPFFQELKKDGLSFTEFFAPVPFSIKSIFAYHSGHYPVANMAPITAARPRVPLKALPEYFREHGYRTALLHGGRFSFTNKLNFLSDRGYDVLHDAQSIPNRAEHERVWWGIDDKAVFSYAKTFIEQSQEPFYIQLIPVLVHHPYNLLKRKSWNYLFDESKRDIDKYHALVRYEDALFEDFVQFLKDKGLYDNTIIVTFGDHGEAFGEHTGNFIHSGAVYEENVRVPMLISNPRLFKGRGESAKLGTLADLYPTLLNLMGWEHPEYDGPGVSLFESDPKRMLFFYAGLGGDKIGIRDGKYKFVYVKGRRALELYDLSADPDERMNIADAHPKRVAFYKERARTWQAHTYDVVHRQLSADPTRLLDRRIIRLTDLPMEFATQGWGKLNFNRNVTGGTFTVGGAEFDTFGFGTHANSIIQFDVSAYPGAQFSARVGRDESAGTELRRRTIIAEVWIDGEVVFRSNELDSSDDPQNVRLKVNGNTLSLVIREGRDGGSGDHADWLEPRLELAN
jgi:arylsulfatase A-like enzyme